MKSPVPKGRRVAFWTVFALAIVVAGIAVNLTDRFDRPRPFDHTAAMYIGVPTLLALALTLVPRPKSIAMGAVKWLTIALLLAVPLLREGFVCVVMAAPILYFIAAFVGALFDGFENWARKRGKSGVEAPMLATVVALLSLEGAHPLLTVDTHQTVVREHVVAASVDEIRERLSEPLTLDAQIPLVARLFPQPVAIAGDGIDVGDERRFHFVYYKWIRWNPHIGDAVFHITRSNPQHIRFEPQKDTSYLSSYLSYRYADLTLEPIDGANTKVRLQIEFDRKLDPSWYFGPLQNYFVGIAADVLILSSANDEQ